MVNEHTADYHPSPSELTSRIHPLIFLWTAKGNISLSLSIYIYFFFSKLYTIMVVENFQIYSVKITGKYICESKNWICSFLLMPTNNTLPQVLIINLQAEGNYPFPQNNIFWKSIFSTAEKGEDYGAEKMTKITPARIFITNLYTFHHLCNLLIFGFCFVVP